ncbi:agmatine deiminase family protein, partial [Ideonella sp.]|uniref:agmatine deiminase family protein n=1 Tax=Ideonella sp. TaxID=1929293 RepID=UPI003BB80F29
VDEQVRMLEAAGRFERLGISSAQGRQLVAAWYRRQGLDARGAAPAQAPAATPTATASVPPAGWRAGREFDPLQAVLLRWPFDWTALRDKYTVMVKAIVDSGAEARIWVDNERQRKAAERVLKQAGINLQRVSWQIENTDTVWLRDYGPNFIHDPAGSGWGVVDFHYYDSRPADDDTPLIVAGAAGALVVDRQRADRVYTEGGNINTDGAGAVLYSTRTYGKNNGVPTATIDARIASAFNAPQRVVLQDPVLDATGHVDMFSKIVGPQTVLVAQYDADEFDHARLEANAALLAAATNGSGQPWQVVRIRQPDVYYDGLVNPVIRTYTNSLIVNDRVIVPVYGIADDADALAIYAALFPTKTIVPLNASAIITSAGAWHCVTMEFTRPGTP